MIQQQPYEIEKIPFGSALVRVLKTIDGTYGLHGETGWDDLPYWEYFDAWIITTQVYGNLDFGPYKQRKNAKKEHKGTSKINILEADILRNEREAEEKALGLALGLEQKGFETEIKFEKDNGQHRDLRRQYSFDETLNPIILRQVRPRLEYLYLKENEREKK